MEGVEVVVLLLIDESNPPYIHYGGIQFGK
jgi:hypothetical protein